MIEVIDARAGSPGQSGCDTFAFACRATSSPLAVIAREGVAESIGEMVQAQLIEVFASRPALLAVALVPSPGRLTSQGLELIAGPESDLWPVAIAMDMRRCALVLGRLERHDDDPWLEVADRLSASGGMVEWALVPGGSAAPRPWPPTSCLPPLDASLPAGSRGPSTKETISSPADETWITLWAGEDVGEPALAVGPERPGPEWRQLGDLLASAFPGGAPLVRRRVSGRPDVYPERVCDEWDETLGWLRATGLPGDAALMLCQGADGRESIHLAEGTPAAVTPVRLLGWARGARSWLVRPTPAIRAAVTPFTVWGARSSDVAWLDTVGRPGTRAVFASRPPGTLSFHPVAGSAPTGYVRVSPGEGRAPVTVDGRVGGYAHRDGLRGAPAAVGAAVDDYLPGPASPVARLKRRAGREVRGRLADAHRLLLVLPWLTIGGADIFVTSLAQELSARGFEIHVVLTYPGAESPGDHRHLIAPYVSDITCVPEQFPGQPLPQVLSALGRKWRIGQMLICGGWQAYGGLPGLRAALPGTRVIDILFNDVGHLSNNRLMSRWIDLTVCAYEGLRDLLVHGYGEATERVATVYIGIDTDRFRPAPAGERGRLKQGIGADPASPLWGYAGRLSEEKCIPDLLAALDLIADELPVTVLVQGDGPAARTVERSVAASRHRVILRPFQDDQLPTLQALDAYILPSRTEGIPLALMEAAACGALPIATAVGGVPDLVVPGITGYLAAPRQPGSLAAAMLAADRTPDAQWAEMAFRARQRVRETMSWPHTVEAYVRILSGE